MVIMTEQEKDAESEYCGICGINMTDKECTVIGKSVKVQGEHKEIQRVKDVFGKTDFKICYVCWLTTLGIKKR